MQRSQLEKWIMAGYPPPNEVTSSQRIQEYLDANNRLISEIMKNQSEKNHEEFVLNMAKFHNNLKFLSAVAEVAPQEQTPNTPQDPRPSGVLQPPNLRPVQCPPGHTPAVPKPGFPQSQQAQFYAPVQPRMPAPHLRNPAQPQQPRQPRVQLAQPQLVQPAQQLVHPAMVILQPAAPQVPQLQQPAVLQLLQPEPQLLVHPAMALLQLAAPQLLQPASQLQQPAPQLLVPQPVTATTDYPFWNFMSPFVNAAPLQQQQQQQQQSEFLDPQLGGSSKSSMLRGDQSSLGKRPAEQSGYFGRSSSENQGLKFTMPAGGIEVGGSSGGRGDSGGGGSSSGGVEDYTKYLNDSDETN